MPSFATFRLVPKKKTLDFNVYLAMVYRASSSLRVIAD
jgi:hypothetical protein